MLGYSGHLVLDVSGGGCFDGGVIPVLVRRDCGTLFHGAILSFVPISNASILDL